MKTGWLDFYTSYIGLGNFLLFCYARRPTKITSSLWSVKFFFGMFLVIISQTDSANWNLKFVCTDLYTWKHDKHQYIYLPLLFFSLDVGAHKLGLEGPTRVFLEDDGTEIDDDDCFLALKEGTILVVGTKWQATSENSTVTAPLGGQHTDTSGIQGNSKSNSKLCAYSTLFINISIATFHFNDKKKLYCW